MRTRIAFKNTIDQRSRAGVGPGAMLPAAKPSFAHGGLSPTNILVTQDNRSALIDFGYSPWLPEYWDAYVLSHGKYTRLVEILEPTGEGLKGKGIWMTPDDPKRVLILRTPS